MLHKSTLDFLTALKDNNYREWFNENKQWYERSRADFEQLVAKIIGAIAAFDPEIGYLEPKKCIFRIYRDVRFSLDKSPYKTHFGAVMRPAGMDKSSGYYLHIDPAECFLTCGRYMLLPDQIKKVRKGIYNDFETFRSIIEEKKFKKEIGDLYRDEDTLQRVPNEFDSNHPAAEYLKLKHFYVLKPVPEEQVLSPDFVNYAASVYRQMQPFGEFVNDLLRE
jgi:uncharacterized protein (TIGR02453 family)